MEFSRQEYWGGLPFSSPGDLPDLRIKPRSPACQADSLPSEPPGKPGKHISMVFKRIWQSQRTVKPGWPEWARDGLWSEVLPELSVTG